MQLIHKTDNLLLENKLPSINEIFTKINKVMENKDTVFSHLRIDNIDVYENHESYIKRNINEIKTIEIITKSKTDMIWETMRSIQQYIERAIPALNDLVDESYENFSDKSWNGINQLAEGMQWILQFASLAKSASRQPSNWKSVESSLQECENCFAPLLEAVENKDTVLILDILSYEVIPAYKTLEKHLTESLKDEEFVKHVN